MRTGEWVYDGGDGFSGIQGFFEHVEEYRYKLHVRVFLSRYRSPFPCPRCEGRAAAPGGARRPRGRLEHRRARRRRPWRSSSASSTTLPLTGWEDVVARDVLRHLRAKLSFLLRVGLGYLTLGAPGPHAVRRRGAAHQPRQPARRPARRHALRPRRAVHRPARARHGAARRALPRARRRSATPWSSSSTTARSSRRPTTSSRWARDRASAAGRWCSRAPRPSSSPTRARSPRAI